MKNHFTICAMPDAKENVSSYARLNQSNSIKNGMYEQDIIEIDLLKGKTIFQSITSNTSIYSYNQLYSTQFLTKLRTLGSIEIALKTRNYLEKRQYYFIVTNESFFCFVINNSAVRYFYPRHTNEPQKFRRYASTKSVTKI